MSAHLFGNDFLWGVAIAAAQNEGAYDADSRGLSIWDVFAKRSGKIKNNATPYEACNFYYRYKDDLRLTKALGFTVFRFSFSWSRIFPGGVGKANREGVAFYHHVIDECLSLGLIPFVTLYHWDLPHELQKEGGWASVQMQKWFHHYVSFCAKEYGAKVKNWIILNEPMGFVSLGYMLGKHAPGKTGIDTFFPAIHNAVIAQAAGGHIIRKLVSNANIGTTFSCSEVLPYTSKPEDIKAANRMDLLLNRLFIEPALGMNYPYDDFPLMDKLYMHSKAWKYTQQMKFDFDFIGIQNYFPLVIKYNSLIPYVQASEVTAPARKVAHTAMKWEINPESFYRVLKRFWNYEGVHNIIVTENGAAFKDVLVNGVINDTARINYFKGYLKQLLKAKQEGVNISGYFVWTLMDNFEWAEGYNPKFGIVHVNFKTQQRIIKNSGYWWKNFLKPS
ncbi:MAG: beta-glucosidase [Sphingobacteriales bacterium]|nr:MAG: beta-glucosidase [Sphingobacteriales bacterium]